MKRILDEPEFLRLLAALPREIAPAQDAWPLISARIAQPAAAARSAAYRPRLWPLATAASFLMILATGLLLKNQWDHSELTPPTGDSEITMTLLQGDSGYTRSSTTGELEYQAALREFMALNFVSGTTEGLRPKWIEQGWGTLRQVELELTAALREEPDNDFLNARLAVLRARQIELLKQIAAVDSASWRTNI